ncbi:hypothetical protein THAR02_10535 [Trichoderma harzianum]|uniref:Uncharacterized protein n=1 Tax=Trichoderma harzianum TaxID=5544 RepID=A0A0F9WY15_TRIHA|nr:hypothetical protein THAR02_10535 [Trichoderma harzianum]
MSLNQSAPPRRKAFVFAEYLEKRAYSCGNGRFIQGPPSPDFEVCFRLHKGKDFAGIYIREGNLLQWLRAVPSLPSHIIDNSFAPFICMDRLLPRYPEMSAKFDQGRREGRSFEALELFVRHFLHQISIFATFGFEHLQKSGILTDSHLHDILSQNYSMSEDLDLLDDAVDEVDERNIKGPNNSLRFADEPIQCQPLTAIRWHESQERRTMAHRLLAKVTDLRQQLFDASTTQGASANFIAFVNRVGTSLVVWRGGTRAIRDICKGHMLYSLSGIVSALQVADAMRSVVPSSRLGCSNEEFINDIPRWASLLSTDDRTLFFEVVSYLWGVSASTVAQEMADSFAHPLMSLQDVDEHLVRASGLFDHGSGIPYRLQTLRQQYLFGMPPTLTAILLYLCLSRYRFSTIYLPIVTADAGQDWASDHITTRNSAIIAIYTGLPSLGEFEVWKITDHLLPKPSPLSPVLPGSPPAERVRESMAAIQASYEGNNPMIDISSVSVVDTVMDCSPSVSSHLTTSSPATTISTSPMTTAEPGSTTMGTSMDGTICCEHCNSKFKLGKNGRRGQASNLQKHMKIHHPETIPNYHRPGYGEWADMKNGYGGDLIFFLFSRALHD